MRIGNTHFSIAWERVILNPDISPEPRKRHAWAARRTSCPRVTASWHWRLGSAFIIPLKQIEYGVYGDLVIMYPKPYSIYSRGDYRGLGTLPFHTVGFFEKQWAL